MRDEATPTRRRSLLHGTVQAPVSWSPLDGISSIYIMSCWKCQHCESSYTREEMKNQIHRLQYVVRCFSPQQMLHRRHSIYAAQKGLILNLLRERKAGVRGRHKVKVTQASPLTRYTHTTYRGEGNKGTRDICYCFLKGECLKTAEINASLLPGREER